MTLVKAIAYDGSHSDALQHYTPRCRGTALPIGVNLSSNAYPTIVLPHPQPLPLPRGGAILALDKIGVG
ncbi:MAG: hypothetical protein KME52_24185 [Desmonostoc geniculatum HA4340-LM1]|jgi:hypothetical protein|nr:hypothetical protein [Desmonostoc geniculatum HA4340-LM1]